MFHSFFQNELHFFFCCCCCLFCCCCWCRVATSTGECDVDFHPVPVHSSLDVSHPPSKSMIIVMIEDLDRQVLELVVNCRKIILHKVHRCLARYSPRAITTNQPTNRAPNEPAGPGPKLTKMPISGQIWAFLGKNPNFYWRNQKFCYPHNEKPT